MAENNAGKKIYTGNLTFGNKNSLENHLNNHYDFRYNSIIERTEFRQKAGKEKTTDFRIVTERDLNSLLRDILSNDIKCNIAKLKSLLNSDFVEATDPFKQYFSGLTWDTKTDHISNLSKTVTTTNQDFWIKCFKKWIVAVVLAQ